MDKHLILMAMIAYALLNIQLIAVVFVLMDIRKALNGLVEWANEEDDVE